MRDGPGSLRTCIGRRTGVCRLLLVRTPYRHRELHDRIEDVDPLLGVREGFAVVMQDLRGRGESEGEFCAKGPDVQGGGTPSRGSAGRARAMAEWRCSACPATGSWSFRRRASVRPAKALPFERQISFVRAVLGEAAVDELPVTSFVLGRNRSERGAPW